MTRQRKTEAEKIDDAVVHTLLSGIPARHRQGALSELSDSQRQQVLESELDGRVEHWNRTHATKWGES